MWMIGKWEGGKKKKRRRKKGRLISWSIWVIYWTTMKKKRKTHTTRDQEIRDQTNTNKTKQTPTRRRTPKTMRDIKELLMKEIN